MTNERLTEIILGIVNDNLDYSKVTMDELLMVEELVKEVIDERTYH